ncbi:MAG: fibronectin type III domain-containing protein, partial [bacterium]
VGNSKPTGKGSPIEAIIFIIICVVITGLIISQTVSIPRIIVGKNFSPTFTWYHTWKDINGNPDQVSHFTIRYIINKCDTSSWVRTEKDTVNFHPPCTHTFKNLEEGLYEIQVRAVDYAGNISNITSSLEFTADKKGWYYLLDCTPPEDPSTLKIQ